MVPTLRATDAEVEALDVAIAFGIVSKSGEPLERDLPAGLDPSSVQVPGYLVNEEWQLVLSFDAAWYPFLLNSRGYNLPDDRWYIPKRSVLIAQVARELQKPYHRSFVDQSGGRVFLGPTGVHRRLASGKAVPVVNWDVGTRSVFLNLKSRLSVKRGDDATGAGT